MRQREETTVQVVISGHEDGAWEQCLTCRESKCQVGGRVERVRVFDRPGRRGWAGGVYTMIPRQRCVGPEGACTDDL